MHEQYALAPDQLRTPCDPADLACADSRELADLGEDFAHQRAVEALRFGLDIRRPGYNLFVLGDPGSGRHAVVRRLIEAECGQGEAPADWCYVNNFADARRPRLLRLPAGRGAGLREALQSLVGELGPAIAAAFEDEEHRQRIEALQKDYRQREEAALRALGHDSLAAGIALLRTSDGFTFAPARNGEETLSAEEFEALPPARQEALNALVEDYQGRLERLLRDFPRWRREAREKLRAASRAALQAAVGHLVDELRTAYADLPQVLAHLDAIEKDVVETGDSLRESQKSEGEMETLLFSGSISVQRYLLNLLVDNGGQRGRPLVYEDHPTFQNLVGRVEHVAHMGMLVSNFTLVKAGALQRANGGFLVLDAERLLAQPHAWEGLKRVIRSGEIRIESPGEMFGLAATQQLEPEPLPLDVKLVLVGERSAYYLLAELDPDFPELFKVAADFESEIARTPENTAQYARLLATLARREGLKPLRAAALARLIEHSARLAEDGERLSTALRPLTEVLVEADYLAGRAAADLVGREHVDAALAARHRRLGRIREEEQAAILRNVVFVASEGRQVGQINGLAAEELGETVFAQPVRITASVRIGEGELIDIEREVELGGPLHSKGVLILAAFLAARFGRLMPLSLNGSIVFEQSYGEIEGDSASLAELCALVSAIGGIPLRQSLAITGSVGQTGVAQPIGAVNEKVEGFFEICKARGLTGEQGVIVPRSNVRNLMLAEEVEREVAAGRFHIYAVEHFDQAIEILADLPIGEPDAKGVVPKGSINFLVAEALAEMAAARHEAGDGHKSQQARKKKKVFVAGREGALPRPD